MSDKSKHCKNGEAYGYYGEVTTWLLRGLISNPATTYHPSLHTGAHNPQ